MTGFWRLRAGVLILVGALAVHHGRYAFATSEHERELAAAHSYLPWLAGAAAVLLFMAVVQLAAYRGRADGCFGPRLPRAPTLWLGATTSLFGVFGAQEGLETLLFRGHLPAPADVLGAGGWTAVPFAVAAGGVIALLLPGAATALRWALGRRGRPVMRQVPRAPMPLRPPLLAAARSVLARRVAGRGPPALSLST
jgi:hypothetical protein